MDTKHCENRLNDIYCHILQHDHLFEGIDYVLVQGDTSTACAIALSAFHHGIKIIHLEAGLRSNDRLDPYPEEMNRQILTRLADIHLCPTVHNKQNLLRENISVHDNTVHVVGNTGIG